MRLRYVLFLSLAAGALLLGFEPTGGEDVRGEMCQVSEVDRFLHPKIGNIVLEARFRCPSAPMTSELLVMSGEPVFGTITQTSVPNLQVGDMLSCDKSRKVSRYSGIAWEWSHYRCTAMYPLPKT